jgi:GDP-mannose 6-dehydrogenase
VNVVVCGLGYVGTVTASCLLKEGHRIVGIDVNEAKAAAIAEGRSPVYEPTVPELLARGHKEGRLSGDTKLSGHLMDADLAFVCVGTPGQRTGALDLSQVLGVARELGAALRERAGSRAPLICVFRSTMPPGTMETAVIPMMVKAAGEDPGRRFEVAYNPEFLRESTAVADYFEPSRIVIGERQPGATNRLWGIYDSINAPVFEVSFRTAEMVKFVDNSFHALKIAFANEIGRAALGLGIDAQRLMQIFVADTKLNISSAYLRPGGPFGGSCLPKDVQALSAYMHQLGLAAPVIESIMASNIAHKGYLTKRVVDALPGGGRILQLGLTFKSGTDDLRESPLVDLAEQLLGKGYRLEIYEPDLREQELVGQNLRYVQYHLPHLSRLLIEDVAESARRADLIVVGKLMPGVLDRFDPASRIVDVQRL